MTNFFSSHFLKDQRDTPFLSHIFQVTFFMLPLSAWVYFNPENIWINLLYVVMVIYFLGPQLLMLHNICHRNPWKKNSKNVFDFIISIQSLFFGLPPMIYYHHHIKMHHKEGNATTDLSSTENFKRDSFIYWLGYFIRFSFLVPFELPYYFFKRNQNKFALKVIAGYIIFIGLIYSSYQYNPSGTIMIFLIPQAICWFGLMGGNWAQHAFIDPSDPKNPFKNSITIIDSLYNKRCFNDGYHIGHHLYPGMHWSEMPAEFERNKDKYSENNALVFKKLDYQMIWFLLMIKQYKFLARFYVPLNGTNKSLDLIAQDLKSRLSPLKS
jgi:fatty acid desaturase